MAWFTKGYLNKQYTYITPERISPTIARERALAAALAKNLKLQERYKRLGARPVSGELKPSTLKFLTDAEVALRRARASTARRQNIRAFETLGAIARANRTMQREGFEKAQPTGSDRRRFNPASSLASDLYGNVARTGLHVREAWKTVNQASWQLNGGWVPRFLNPNAVVPCVSRKLRREVMFAKKKAGRGYATKKRRNENSGVPC